MSALSIKSFGKILLRTGDLDPVYLALNGAKLPEAQLHRLLLAYWCFYHLGAAAQLSEIKDPKKYWFAMSTAALNESRQDGSKPWPRGSERRHFRGAQAVTPMTKLVARYKTATDAVLGFVGINRNGPFPPMTYGSVSKTAMTHSGFGPWIAFKIADMSERVLGYAVDFSDCALGIYKDPRQGAAVAYLGLTGNLEGLGGQHPWDYPITDEELARTVNQYVKVFRDCKCAGLKRKVNVQEVETIFCKYKSYLKGHYPVGKDSEEIRHGLYGWGETATELARFTPDYVWAKEVLKENP